MKRRTRYTPWLFAAGLLFAASGCWPQPANAQPLTGTWDFVMHIEKQNRDIPMSLVLEQQNQNVEATLAAPDVSWSFTGTIIGDSLHLDNHYKEGNGKMAIATYIGLVEGDAMKGHVSFRWADGKPFGGVFPWSAKRANAAAPIADTAQKTSFRVHDLPEKELTDRFQSTLDSIHHQEHFPGAIAAFLLDDGRTGLVATGRADQENQIDMAVTDRMLAGSIGKSFVAAVALDLVHEGLLDLDAHISTWLGDEPWFARLPNANDITLRMLLNHTSGLPDHAYDARFASAIQEMAKNIETYRDHALSPHELVAFVLDQDPLFAAGTGYKYTDTGYILVGLIIEKATKSTFYEQLQTRFLDPLSLAQTSPANQRTLPGLVPGYMAPDNPLGLPAKTVEEGAMIFNPATEWTGGGLVSNPKDLVRWAKALYEGNAMDGAYLEDLLDPGKENYGLGVSISEYDMGTFYGHDGWFPGYRAKVAYFPEYKMAVAVQVNTDVDVDMGAYVSQLVRVLLDATPE